MPDLRIIDPLALPLVEISPASAQWLVDSKMVDPWPQGLFAGLVAGKQSPQTPKDLQALGLAQTTSSAANIDRSKAPYLTALPVVTAPARRIDIALREGGEASALVYFLKSGFVASGYVAPKTRLLSAAFSSAVLATGLARQLESTDAPWMAALLPTVLGALGRAFVSGRRVVSLPEKAIAAPELKTLVGIGAVVVEGGSIRPSNDYTRALEATWSGQAMVMTVSSFSASGSNDKPQVFTFVGPPKSRLWTYDEALPKGRVATVFRALDSSESVNIAGVIAGL